MISRILQVLRNSTLSLIASATARASNTILFILISRRLGATEGGIFSLALTYALLFTQLSLWGMDQLLTREVAKDRSLASKFTGSFILIRGGLALILFALMAVLVTRVIGYAPQTSLVIIIVGLGILPESMSNICQALFFAFEKMEYSALTGLVLGAFRLFGGVLVLLLGGRIRTIALILFASNLIGLIVSLGIVYLRFPRPVWRFHATFWLSQLKTALPFALISVFYIIEFQADVLLLSIFKTERQVGIYNAATTLLFALALIPQAFRVAVLPLMSKLYAEASPLLTLLYERAFKYLLLIALPISSALMLSADSVIRILFGPGFETSAAALQVVIWTFVLFMVNVPNARMMVVVDAQHMLALFQGLSMSLNLVLNFTMIPRVGVLGAACARLVSTGLFVVLEIGYIYLRLNRWNPLQAMGRVLIAAIAATGFGVLLRQWDELLAVIGSLVIYVTFAWQMNVIPQEDQVFFVKIWRNFCRAGLGRREEI